MDWPDYLRDQAVGYRYFAQTAEVEKVPMGPDAFKARAQAQEETFATTYRYVSSSVDLLLSRNCRLGGRPRAWVPPNPAVLKSISRRSSEVDSTGGSEANPSGDSEIIPGLDGRTAISIERMCQIIEEM